MRENIPIEIMDKLSELIGKSFDQDGYGPDLYSCYGLAWKIFEIFGVNIPKTNISVCACKEDSVKEIETHIRKYWVLTKRLVAPTIILIKPSDIRNAPHIGTYVGYNKMMHITKDTNAGMEPVYNWKNRIMGYYRYVNNN